VNILWLYRYTPHRHYNHWFHTDFARVLSEQENINLRMYGFRMHENNEFHDLLFKEYDEKITMSDLKKEFDYDIVILDCWNRAYTSVSVKKLWIPEDFKDLNIPKIVIEGDYHNIKDPKLYLNLNIDAIFHRHLSNVQRAKEDLSIENIWLPVSIDNNIFKPNLEIARQNKICAIGEFNANVYEYRKRALKILKCNNLVAKEDLLREDAYINCLQSYTSHLSCSSIYDLDIAKSFEIMACGSVLLTDKCNRNGMEKLFSNNSYCSYKRDYSDLISVAKKILNDVDYRRYITKNAIKNIEKKHTHQIRVQEFLNHIIKTFNLSYETQIHKTEPKSLFNQICILLSDKETNNEPNKNEKTEEIKESSKVIVKEDITYDENLSILNESKLQQLYQKHIEVCLLKDTCYEVIINNRVGNKLDIAVNKKDIAKKILGDDFTFHLMPENTKKFNYKDMTFYVPCPVVSYLRTFYGEIVIKQLENKTKKLRLENGIYKFVKRK